MQRLRFANQLRGIAALGVACSHLIGVFWVIPEVVSAVTASPPQEGAVPGIFWIVGNPWINLGPLGVALFFLISGFVIPFSLEKHSRLSFLAARLLRIYPTYVAALAIELLAVAAAAKGWNRPLPYTAPVVIGNALLVYDLIGQSSVDLVNWTLSVELKFYLLAALLQGALRRGSMAAPILTGLAILAANAAARWIWPNAALDPGSLVYTLSAHSLCLTYMLLGTAWNAHLRGLVSTARLAMTLTVMGGLFLVTWQVSVWAGQYPVVTMNYLYAVVIFGLLYACRRWIPANPVLDTMAAISFPFYLIHSLLGYVVLRFSMVRLGWTYYPSLAAALVVVVTVAAGLHMVVERPTMRAGRRLTGLRITAMSPHCYQKVGSFTRLLASKLLPSRY